ncbi:MAG: hypothetical protein JOY91_11430 [Sinobacteraceae bacterium]|nr:hypothetical protein [Nevskiaceae bacterium]
MPDIVKRHAVSVALLALTAAACSRGPAAGDDRMGWARAALERNAAIAVVAADAQAGTFTVRVKETGELRIVPLDQLVAGPVGTVGPVPTGARRGNGITAGNSAEAANTAAAAGAAGAADSTESAHTPEPTNPTAADNTASDTVSGGTPAPSELASPGESARAANQQPANSGTAVQPVAGPRATSAASAPAGQVLASGPGYTIKASGARGGDAGATAVRTARGIPLERLHDPIICQGARLLHIDNRNLQFDGDAISAENGCEIHITNSHIRAGGVGVQARAANVYVENSDIEGESGAIDAAQGAQIYAEASRFKGLTRRQQASDFHDLGGNVWN